MAKEEAKYKGKKVTAGKESEELQAKGWTVNHSVIEGGVKVHYLQEPPKAEGVKDEKK